MYADYEFYTDTYFGEVISEADFPRLASKASDFIDYYTRGKAAKAPEDDEIRVLLGKACCAVAEGIKANEEADAIAAKARAAALDGNGELKSESVGSYSVSYATSADYSSRGSGEALRDERAGYASIVSMYLANTGLLFRGCC